MDDELESWIDHIPDKSIKCDRCKADENHLTFGRVKERDAFLCEECFLLYSCLENKKLK